MVSISKYSKAKVDYSASRLKYIKISMSVQAENMLKCMNLFIFLAVFGRKFRKVGNS